MDSPRRLICGRYYRDLRAFANLILKNGAAVQFILSRFQSAGIRISEPGLSIQTQVMPLTR